MAENPPPLRRESFEAFKKLMPPSDERYDDSVERLQAISEMIASLRHMMLCDDVCDADVLEEIASQNLLLSMASLEQAERFLRISATLQMRARCGRG